MALPENPNDTGAWWRHPMMWLVVGAPAVAVLASVSFAVIAIRTPDPVLRTDTTGTSVAPAARDAASIGPDKAMLPALTGRNHAATPPADLPRPRL